MKEFLSRAGKSYTERLVDEDDAAYDALLALGYRAVPVTVIGSHVIVGFDEAGLATALAAGD